MNTSLRHLLPGVLLALSELWLHAGSPSTAFTYQGRLFDGGAPANGLYDLQFTLYDDPNAGNQLGAVLTTNGIPVNNGVFTVLLDFGAVFDGSGRWLDVAERTNGAAVFGTLSPRQFLAAAPSATFAANAGTAAALSGTLPLNQLPPGVITNQFADDFIIQGHNLSVEGNLVVTNRSTFNGDGIYNGGLRVGELLSAQGGLAVSGDLTCDSWVGCSDLLARDSIHCGYLQATNLGIYCSGLTSWGLLSAQGGLAVSAGLTVDGPVSAANTIYADSAAQNTGALSPGLIFGGTGSAEGISSKRTSGTDQYGLDFYTQGYIRMTVNNNGNVGIGTTTPGNLLTVGNSGSPAYCNGTSWVNGSDRNGKENFAAINPRVVLEKVSALPITEWKYKVEADGTKHIGPMAQDFHAAFGLNGPDDKHIATVDADGVALAAIQGLNQKLEETRADNAALRADNADLRARLEKLERLLQSPK